MNEIEQLKDFLIGKEIFDDFCIGIRNRHNRDFSDYIESKGSNLSNVIDNALTWSKTRQGQDYWYSVCEEWKKFWLHRKKKGCRSIW